MPAWPLVISPDLGSEQFESFCSARAAPACFLSSQVWPGQAPPLWAGRWCGACMRHACHSRRHGAPHSAGWPRPSAATDAGQACRPACCACRDSPALEPCGRSSWWSSGARPHATGCWRSRLPSWVTLSQPSPSCAGELGSQLFCKAPYPISSPLASTLDGSALASCLLGHPRRSLQGRQTCCLHVSSVQPLLGASIRCQPPELARVSVSHWSGR